MTREITALPCGFLGAATVPFDALEASILEARRAVWELGLQAVLIPGNRLGRRASAGRLAPRGFPASKRFRPG